MRALGCLGILLLVAVLAIEAWSYVIVARLIDARTHSSGILETIILQVALMFIGVAVARRHIAKLPAAAMQALAGGGGTEAGRRVVGLIGGILLVFPGFFSDVLGILFILPPVQHLFARAATRVGMAMIKQAMQRAMGGKMAGMGFPPPGGFPFGQPDERFRAGGFAPRGPRTFETTAEPADPPRRIDP